MSAIYTKRKHVLNINESVYQSMRYALRQYKKFTAWDILAIINNTVEYEEDRITIRQVQNRISWHKRYSFSRLVKDSNSAYYFIEEN